MHRIAAAVVAGVLPLSAVVAFAATLDVSAQALAAGSDAVGRCDTTFAVDYVTEEREDASALTLLVEEPSGPETPMDEVSPPEETTAREETTPTDGSSPDEVVFETMSVDPLAADEGLGSGESLQAASTTTYITGVEVDGIDGACFGGDLSLVVLDGEGEVLTDGDLADVDASSEVVSVNDVEAATAAEVALVIVGPASP